MRQILFILTILLTLFVGIFTPSIRAADTAPSSVRVYVFYSQSCPHCGHLIDYLEEIQPQYSDQVEFVLFLVEDRRNTALMQEMGRKIEGFDGRVPFTVIGNNTVLGFGSVATTGQELIQLIDDCLANSCQDVLSRNVDLSRGVASDLDGNRVQVTPILTTDSEATVAAALATPIPKDINTAQVSTIDLPLLGAVDIKTWSLPLLSIVIGALDGFNPCAMWVLVFLIGLLLNMQDKKRMWLLGITFILTSGLVYLLFMTAWLQFFLIVGFIPIIRLIIGSVAIGSGIIHFKKWYEHKYQCEVIPAERRKKVFGKLEEITKNQSLTIALIGIVGLAISVNMVELVCSAGLPAIYTNILSMSNLSWWEYGFNLLLYILMFMADDLLVFIIAMKTLQLTGISQRYTHSANLIGGIIIGLLGFLLIFKPEWVMFA